MMVCKKCGTEFMDGVNVCPACGHDVENNIEPQDVESKKFPKKGKFIAIFVPIIAIVIGRLVGGFIGEFTAKNMMESGQKNDIEEFIEQMEQYVPGHCDGNEYTSETFGFKFVIDENWGFYTDEDLTLASESLDTTMTSTALAELEKEDISQKLKEKFEESLYAKAEMGALYIADDIYVGEVIVSVMSGYGIEDVSVDEYVEGIKNNLSTTAQVTDEYIAGSTYNVISANITDVNGIDTMVKLYTKIENNMVCTITCRAVVGYEEQLFKAFEDGISAY